MNAHEEPLEITHEELCALVLEELDAPERERVERALAASPELRAERERIAATIGLVQAACAGSQALSGEALARLERSAGPSRPWYAHGWMRAAAGFTLLAGGLIAVQEASRRGPSVGPRDDVASLERSAADRAADEARALLKKDRAGAAVLFSSDGTEPHDPSAQTRVGGLDVRTIDLDGFGGGTGSPESMPAPKASAANPSIALRARAEAPRGTNAPGSSLAGPPRDPAAGEVLGGELARLESAQVYRLQTQPAQEREAVLQALEGLGYSGNVPQPEPSGASRTYELSLGRPARDAETAAVGAPLVDARIVEQQRAKAPAEAKRGGGSTPSMGGGGGGGPEGPTTPGPAGAAPAGGGTWRGPGDSSPPAPPGRAGDDGFFAGRQGAVYYDLDADRALLDLDTLVEQRVERVLEGCRRRPHERPSAMYFRFWGDNPFVLAQLDAQSTFGVDVDTASYALARRYLSEGLLPEKAQIRTEEFVNYFAPDVPAPTDDTFALVTELAPSRFGGPNAQRWMLRVALRGKEVSREERQPLALTFVIDTSGSMKRENRLDLVKHSLRLLVGELDARDSIALVAFSNEARLVLPMTSAANRGLIETAIFGLNADGGTNAEAGLKLGYELARTSLSQAALSRVVLLSDGVANIGQTDQDRIAEDVRRQREAGIYLNTVGVGLGNHNDVFLEQLADKGDGLCNYVDGPPEARRALVDNFTGAFQPIARDVKVQVEFDPARVYRYRLLGYENRAIADQDFRNDKVDAGEVGAGHQVTALYELELAAPPTGDDAKLATVRLRWKAPSGAGRDPLEDTATEREFGVAGADATSWEGASAGFKRAAVAAQFAEILRRSSHAADDSLDELIAEAAKLDRELSDADFRELLALMETSRQLVLAARPPRHDPLERCVDTLRRNRILHAELEELRWERDAKVLEDLELQNRELEARIRQLVREKAEAELR